MEPRTGMASVEPESGPAESSTVIYAKDLAKLAEFYRKTLSLSVREQAERYVVLGDQRVEIIIVRMADDVAAREPISDPPQLREETPIKPSFRVNDLGPLEIAAREAGGGTKARSSTWSWRGELHLDGYDPEGNVVQFRQRQA